MIKNKTRRRIGVIAGMLISLILAAGPASAKVDLVTLPGRDTVQLTIYNSADLTLVRESRLLTLKKGVNRLQFSWANTLIDPTSLELLPREQAAKIQIADLDYPPRVQNLGVWTIQSEISGKVPVEITYLTSGLSWRAFYLGILAKDEKTMFLEAYVRVTNQSGEDYENAQTRMIVGTIHLLDEIAALARRQYPYGRPDEGIGGDGRSGGAAGEEMRMMKEMAVSDSVAGAPVAQAPKEVKKEGLSEYFLYTIEGTETIPTGWSKRLPSFTKDKVPVVNLYKFEEERFGKSVVRFLSFKNDKKHKLGDTPIPGGTLRAFRQAGDAAGSLTYEGQSAFKYIPVNEDVELNLGAVANVIVEPKIMNFKTDNFMFNQSGDICGWDEIREVKIEVKNTRPLPVKVEIRRNFPVPAWDLKNSGDFGDYEKVDLDTVKFTLKLDAQTKKEFRYTLTTRHGTRAE